MDPSSARWREITRSQFAWEREALAFVRAGLPDHEPYRAWASFELVAQDGSINEVDLLVLAPKGLFLVEIKSWPGIVEGDAGTWTRRADGKVVTFDDPLLLANRKAKKLKDLLARQKAMAKTRMPFVEALVFLAHERVDCRLPAPLRESVHTRESILAALSRWRPDAPPRQRLDRPFAKALGQAMEEAGIRPSQGVRRVGDYRLGELLFDGPGYQDWEAEHVSVAGDRCRVRIYSSERGASAEARQTLAAAARREYQILSGIQHERILRARHYSESERGPALFFEHRPGAQRLDHYLAERLASLSVDERLELLEQLAETVRYAHEKRLVHRALSPQSVLVEDPAAARPRLLIFNWQTGARRAASSGLASSGAGRGPTPTTHVEELVENRSLVYLAPEPWLRGGDDEKRDVFSLGAIAYHLFAGGPPAASFYELEEKLREGQGLRLSAVVDGVPESLERLVRHATRPLVGDRMDSAAELVAAVEAVWEELTAPAHEALVDDPTLARPGDVVAHDGAGRPLTVVRRLGRGASAVAFLVSVDGREQVLKVALEPSHNERLSGEAEVLQGLPRHQGIVALREVVRVGERVGLLLEKAGDKTLAQRLREEGRLQLELLERFGEDLLQAVHWLEEQGVSHRDVKPENLGVGKVGQGDQLHLVLFDFSLARTPAENLRAGTVPYLDPFLSLRRPPRWDVHAERFAAAVTLYQMATGQLPQWGDGQSDPALLEVEATLDAETFEPEVREGMTAFFARALRRDASQRFDNAKEMLAAWRDLFRGVGAPARAGVRAEAGEASGELPASVTLPTPLHLLAFSTRALNALERDGVSTVAELLRTPPSRISRMRGVGSKTRREILGVYKLLADRFPDLERPPEAPAEAPAAAGDLAVDLLAHQLLPAGGGAAAARSREALLTFLGLAGDAGPWPSQSDAARALGLTRERLRQVVARARERWSKQPAMTALREEVAALLDAHGGVASGAELAEALLSRRGSAQAEPLAGRQARAVVRAALETERERAAPRWIVRRPADGAHLVLARDEAGVAGAGLDGQGLADWAEGLGRRADELAAADPLLAPERVVEALASVALPPGFAPPPGARQRQLAVALSRRAALSSRLEVYPRGMAAPRALKLALGAVAGARRLTVEELCERVRSRYPEAAPLPGRPALDELLAEAGSELVWRPEEGAYVSSLRDFTTVETGSSLSRPVVPRFAEVPAEEAEARAFEERLAASIAARGFLALVVSPRQTARARRLLAASFAVVVRDLDVMLVRHMRAFAAEKRVAWSTILAADAVPREERAASRDWANLLRVVEEGLARVRAELAATAEHVLLVRPGLLARYDRLSFLDEARDAAGRVGGLPGLWVLVTGDAQDPRPVLDGRPVPVFTTAQWARVPEVWLAARGGRGGAEEDGLE